MLMEGGQKLYFPKYSVELKCFQMFKFINNVKILHFNTKVKKQTNRIFILQQVWVFWLFVSN